MGRAGALWRWGWQPGDARRIWSCWHALTSLALPSVILAGCTQWKWCDTHIAWSWTQSKNYRAWKAEKCYTMQGNNTSLSSGRDRSQAHSELCTFSAFLWMWIFVCFSCFYFSVESYWCTLHVCITLDYLKPHYWSSRPRNKTFPVSKLLSVWTDLNITT